MKLIKTPTKGMNDYLPAQAELRDYVMEVIRDEYAKYGFSRIETPAVEHIENLTGKDGGENEKLIFKILKRGEKLENAAEGELCDSGLRYDLTLPLVRYYSNNAASLPMPFLALQTGPVWRADRPQKGRFRQFTQCDIDIIGDATPGAEITLISATTSVLKRLGFSGFTVKINDRRLLRGAALSCGFEAESLENVFITLDKADKIGLDGVKEELLREGCPTDAVAKYMALYSACADTPTVFASQLGDDARAAAAELEELIETASAVSEGSGLKFDPSLVRGMSYYTGTIFEITMDGYGYSVGGGGRYDGMIAKFTGQKVPACGFSLGFERIVGALADSGFTVPRAGEGTAILVEKDIGKEESRKLYVEAAAMRARGERVLVTPKMKNAGFQMNNLEAAGWKKFIVWGKDGVSRPAGAKQ